VTGCNLSSGYRLLLIFPLEGAADPYESESPTQPTPSSGDLRADVSVEFPPVSPDNLIRLGEDLLRTNSLPISGDFYPVPRSTQYLSPISNLMQTLKRLKGNGRPGLA